MIENSPASPVPPFAKTEIHKIEVLIAAKKRGYPPLDRMIGRTPLPARTISA